MRGVLSGQSEAARASWVADRPGNRSSAIARPKVQRRGRTVELLVRPYTGVVAEGMEHLRHRVSVPCGVERFNGSASHHTGPFPAMATAARARMASRAAEESAAKERAAAKAASCSLGKLMPRSATSGSSVSV